MGAVLGTVMWPAILLGFFFPSKAYWNVLYVFIIVLTSIYIVYDTKKIMRDYAVDEYIIAALMLYVDIIQLFIFILSLLGGGGGN